jgi:hypothetical protein
VCGTDGAGKITLEMLKKLLAVTLCGYLPDQIVEFRNDLQRQTFVSCPFAKS